MDLKNTSLTIPKTRMTGFVLLQQDANNDASSCQFTTNYDWTGRVVQMDLTGLPIIGTPSLEMGLLGVTDLATYLTTGNADQAPGESQSDVIQVPKAVFAENNYPYEFGINAPGVYVQQMEDQFVKPGIFSPNMSPLICGLQNFYDSQGNYDFLYYGGFFMSGWPFTGSVSDGFNNNSGNITFGRPIMADANAFIGGEVLFIHSGRPDNFISGNISLNDPWRAITPTSVNDDVAFHKSIYPRFARIERYIILTDYLRLMDDKLQAANAQAIQIMKGYLDQLSNFGFTYDYIPIANFTNDVTKSLTQAKVKEFFGL